ncbi:hypothetical protein LSAT2_000802 [Lamellibrachia satsuma]|nr:hypothetical protein LSAT2_000802 [Lamellibrachia satsuma]
MTEYYSRSQLRCFPGILLEVCDGMSVTGDDTSQNDTVSQVTSSKPTYDATSYQPTPNNVTIVTSDNGQLTQLSLSSLSPGSLSSLGHIAASRAALAILYTSRLPL